MEMPAMKQQPAYTRMEKSGSFIERVNVSCNGVKAVFLIHTQTIVCHCPTCTNNGQEGSRAMSPTEFERHSGMQASKKWRRSIKVDVVGKNGREASISLGRWLEQNGFKTTTPAGMTPPMVGQPAQQPKQMGVNSPFNGAGIMYDLPNLIAPQQQADDAPYSRSYQRKRSSRYARPTEQEEEAEEEEEDIDDDADVDTKDDEALLAADALNLLRSNDSMSAEHHHIPRGYGKGRPEELSPGSGRLSSEHFKVSGGARTTPRAEAQSHPAGAQGRTHRLASGQAGSNHVNSTPKSHHKASAAAHSTSVPQSPSTSESSHRGKPLGRRAAAAAAHNTIKQAIMQEQESGDYDDTGSDSPSAARQPQYLNVVAHHLADGPSPLGRRKAAGAMPEQEDDGDVPVTENLLSDHNHRAGNSHRVSLKHQHMHGMPGPWMHGGYSNMPGLTLQPAPHYPSHMMMGPMGGMPGTMGQYGMPQQYPGHMSSSTSTGYYDMGMGNPLMLNACGATGKRKPGPAAHVSGSKPSKKAKHDDVESEADEEDDEEEGSPQPGQNNTGNNTNQSDQVVMAPVMPSGGIPENMVIRAVPVGRRSKKFSQQTGGMGMGMNMGMGMMPPPGCYPGMQPGCYPGIMRASHMMGPVTPMMMPAGTGYMAPMMMQQPGMMPHAQGRNGMMMQQQMMMTPGMYGNGMMMGYHPQGSMQMYGNGMPMAQGGMYMHSMPPGAGAMGGYGGMRNDDNDDEDEECDEDGDNSGAGTEQKASTGVDNVPRGHSAPLSKPSPDGDDNAIEERVPLSAVKAEPGSHHPHSSIMPDDATVSGNAAAAGNASVGDGADRTGEGTSSVKQVMVVVDVKDEPLNVGPALDLSKPPAAPSCVVKANELAVGHVAVDDSERADQAEGVDGAEV